MPNDNLYFDDILPIVESALSRAKDKPLKRIEIVVLQAAWSGATYDDIAERSPYTAGNLQQRAAPPLWKRLSVAFGHEVNKKRFRSTVELIAEQSNQDFAKIHAQDRRFIGTAPSLDNFVGRKSEINELYEDIAQSRCVFVEGSAGIGKSSLASKAFSQYKSIGGFDVYVWKYCLYDDPSKDVEDLLTLLQDSQTDLVNVLRKHRYLIVLDGIDRWFGQHRTEAEDLIRQLIESEHQSSIVFTGRESLSLVKGLIRGGRPVRDLHLNGLSLKDSKFLFKDYGIQGSKIDELIESYQGNPLLLHNACERIRSCGDDVESIIGSKTSLAGDMLRNSINDILKNSQIGEVERFILAFLSRKLESRSMPRHDVLSEIKKESSLYSLSAILEGLDALERYHLIDIKSSSKIDLVSVPSIIRKYVLSSQFNPALNC
jgi:NB-ARC domain